MKIGAAALGAGAGAGIWMPSLCEQTAEHQLQSHKVHLVEPQADRLKYVRRNQTLAPSGFL